MTPAVYLPTLVEPIIMVWLCLVGACVGSFLNVVVFRLPRRCLSIFKPVWSFCPRCRHQIRWFENIPILSWIALRARCSSCKQPIAIRYPSVELVTMLLFGWLAWRDLAGRIDEPTAWGMFLVHTAFGCALLVCTLIDFDHRIIPDEIDVPGIVLAPLAVAAFPQLLGPHLPDPAGWAARAVLSLESPLGWWGVAGVLTPLEALAELPISHPGAYPHVAGLVGGVFGAAMGAGFIFAVGEVFSRMLGRDAMGFGDVKFLGMIGGLTGWQGVVATIVIACFAGSIGGVLHMVWSGRAQLRRSDLAPDLTPISAAALWVTGARGMVPPGATADDPVPRLPGTGLFARLATGDPYLPFGPFLALGAFVAAFWPGLLAATLGPGG